MAENGSGNDRKEPSSERWLKRIIWEFICVTILWGFICMVGRFVRRFLITVGLVAILGVLGYVFLEEMVNRFDRSHTEWVDRQLGTDYRIVEKLRDPGYFAEQTEFVSEGQASLACISSSEHRVVITDPANIPAHFRNAIIASEDKNFFSHFGVSKEDVARAAVNRYILRRSRSGASTLTMQIAKHLRGGTGLHTTEKQKIQDMMTAVRIEREFPSKQQIFLKYVNMPYFGRGQYGIEAASRAYFGKPAKELELHQVAFVVSLINKPALPDRTFTHDRTAKTPEEIRNANWREALRGTRRVLELMVEEDFIDDIEYARAANAIDRGLRNEVLKKWTSCGAGNYYMESIRQYVVSKGFRVDRGGLTVPSPFDGGMQDILERAVQTTVDIYLARNKDDVDNDQLRAGALVVDFTGKVLAQVGNIDFKKIQHDVIRGGWRQPGSSFKPYVYGARVEQIVNDVLEGDNPPESLDELIAEATRRCVVLDEPIGVSLGRGKGVKPIRNFRSNNPKEKQYWGLMTCKEAIGRSQNAAAVRAGKMTGIKNVIEFTYRLGMPRDAKHPLQPYPTTAIGASEVNPLGMSGLAALVNGGYKVTPRFANDICKDGKSLIYSEEDGSQRGCDLKGERYPSQERVVHPAVAAVMADILKGPLDDEFGTAKSLRRGVIPGMDILGSEIWKLKPDEKKKRTLAFPLEEAGEIAGKTGTATNWDGKTSDVWLLLFIPGPPENPEKGLMLLFWMGKDSKDHPLGNRGIGGSGFAETGGRNWTHSAAMVLAFLQKERGYLKRGYRFRPIYRDETPPMPLPQGDKTPDPNAVMIVDPLDPSTPPELVKELMEQDVSLPSPNESGATSVEAPKD